MCLFSVLETRIVVLHQMKQIVALCLKDKQDSCQIFGTTLNSDSLARLGVEKNWELNHKMCQQHSGELLPFTLDQWPFKSLDGPSTVQMRSPSASRWPQIAAGRHTAGRERGCHCTIWPRGTPWISDPELRWSTISSFSDWNNKSQPFDSAQHPPPPPRSSPPVLWNKHQAEVSLWSCRPPWFTEGQYLGFQSDMA